MNNLNALGRWGLAVAMIMAPLGAAHATFPGENGDIVYSEKPGELPSGDYLNDNIVRLRPDGTKTVVGIGRRPMVSPNGKQVAYDYAYDFGTFRRVRVMNIDGSNVVDLGDGRIPAWSPDGRALALYGYYNGVDGIYKVSLDGGPRGLLVENPDANSSAIYRVSWSPMGDKIAFSTRADSYVMPASGGTLTRIPTLVEPSWFPDGKSLAFVGSDNLYATNADGSNRRVVDPNFSPWEPPGLVGWPFVSPDGLNYGWYHFGADPAPTPQGAFTVKFGSIQPNRFGWNSERVDWGRRLMTAMRATLVNGQWSAPVPQPGDGQDAYNGQSAVVVMPDGGSKSGTLQQVITAGSDGRLYHRVQKTDGGWLSPTLVPGGGGSSAGIYPSRIAIAGAMDGSSQVVIVNKLDNLVYHAMRYANGTWSGFTALNSYAGSANPNPAARDVFAARDVAIAIGGSSSSSPGTAQVVASGLAGGAVFHRARLPDGSWTPFALPPGSPTNMDQVAIATALNGDAYVLAAGPSTGIVRQLRLADGSWDAWVNMANVPTALKDVSLTIGRNSYGQHVAKVAYVASNGSVQYQQREDAQRQSAWTNPTIQPANLVSEGRSVSISNTDTGAELVVTQAQQ